jgi:hypothetical protein
MEPLPTPDDCATLDRYAVLPIEARVAQLYYEGDTEQRVSQMVGLSRHRIRGILRSLARRAEAGRLPLVLEEPVYWYGLDRRCYDGWVVSALTLEERDAANIRAEDADEDWYLVQVGERTIVKRGDQLFAMNQQG